MPGWGEVLKEICTCQIENPLDFVRRKYLKELSEYTGRNVIAYYSGWLQHPGLNNTSINDDDKNSLMATIHQIDRTKGLDLILHTPGGDTAATESLVNYIRAMFNDDVRAIIPQLAMSAGTMIACSCKEIIMGKQSNLGPIDPQFGGIPAYGVLSEFNKAVEDVKLDPQKLPLWQVIISKYHPTFIGECENAIRMSSQMVLDWLQTGMFKDNPYKEKISKQIVEGLNNHADTMSHARHIHIEECKSMGLKITDMEADQKLQDLILTIHHSYMHTFANSSALKIVENQEGVAVILNSKNN